MVTTGCFFKAPQSSNFNGPLGRNTLAKHIEILVFLFFFLELKGGVLFLLFGGTSLILVLLPDITGEMYRRSFDPYRRRQVPRECEEGHRRSLAVLAGTWRRGYILNPRARLLTVASDSVASSGLFPKQFTVGVLS